MTRTQHEMTINDLTLDQYAADIAGEVLGECIAYGELRARDGDRDAAVDMAHVHADGSEWAIYYHKAHELCQNCNTDNGEQFFEEQFSEDFVPSDDITYDRIATIIAYGELYARIVRAIDAKIDEMRNK